MESLPTFTSANQSNKIMENLVALYHQCQEFSLEEAAAGSSLKRLEKYEAKFAAWKKANGFPNSYDSGDVQIELTGKMTQAELDILFV